MNKELYNEWIEIADGDFDLAKKVYESKWPKQNIRICFHCQQAAEKYLKGYLVYHEEEIVKTHILDELIDKCLIYDKEFEDLRIAGTYLTPFAVQVRYPDNSFDITEVEVKQAINYTEKIINFITVKIEKEEQEK